MGKGGKKGNGMRCWCFESGWEGARTRRGVPAPSLPLAAARGLSVLAALPLFWGGEQIKKKHKQQQNKAEAARKVPPEVCQDGEDGMRGKSEAAMAARRVFHLQPCGEQPRWQERGQAPGDG